MLKPIRLFAFAGCLSLVSVGSAAAGEPGTDSAYSASIQVLKAGGRYMLSAVLCDADRAPIEERVHAILDEGIGNRPAPRLQATHEQMDDYMAEEASQEYIRDRKRCDADTMALAKASFEASVSEAVAHPQAR